MDGTKAKGKRATAPAPRSRASDALVVLAMTLVTVALAIGLYLQFRLAFWLALIAALSVYIGLLTLHALVRRSERVGQLTAEVERLEDELAALRKGVAPGVAAGMAATAAAAPLARPPVAGEAAPAKKPNPASTDATRPAGAPDARTAPPPQPRSEPGVPAADAWSFRPADAPRLGSSMPNAAAPRAPAPAAVVPATIGGSGAVVAADPARQEAPKRETVPAGRDGPPPLPGIAQASQASPGAAPDAPASRREADVEMIQGLIKKLADEVNAAEASLLKPPRAPMPAASAGRGTPAPPVLPSTAAAIERSVNALRTTADTMRSGGATAALPASDGAPAAATQANPSAAAPGAETAARARLRAAAPRAETEMPRAETAMPRADMAMPRAEMATDVAQPARSAGPPAVPPPLPPLWSAGEGPPAPPRLPELPVASAELTATSFRPIDPRLPEPAPGVPSAATQADLGPMPPPLPWPDETDAEAPGPPTIGASQQPAVAHARLAALAEAITAGRFDVMLDPILGLADQRARHFEISLRLRDKAGQVLDPPDSVPELRESGLLPLLDCARITRSAQFAQRLADRGKDGSVFSVFSGEALSHDQFLSEFADAVSQREALSGQLVLSFAQSDVRSFAGRDWDTLAEMRELGFRFALQSVTDLDLDFEALKAAGFDFVKLDALVFLEGMHASGGIIPTADICRHLSALGMTLVVGEIENEGDLARIFGFGVIYGQGRLFGGARPVKAEALAAAETAAA